MDDNRFERNGFTFIGWDYEVPLQSESGYINLGDELGDRNLYNAYIDETKNPPVASVGEPTELKSVWQENTYKIIFDFNDGADGYADTYRGTTYVSTRSITDPTQPADELIEVEHGYVPATGREEFYIEIEYAHPMTDNFSTLDIEAFAPARHGYTFDGWYMSKSADKADEKVLNSTIASWSNMSKDHETGAWVKATDSKVYAKWKKNDYTLRFLAKDSADSDIPNTITGSIPDISLTFDNLDEKEIPAIRKADGSFIEIPESR